MPYNEICPNFEPNIGIVSTSRNPEFSMFFLTFPDFPGYKI